MNTRQPYGILPVGLLCVSRMFCHNNSDGEGSSSTYVTNACIGIDDTLHINYTLRSTHAPGCLGRWDAAACGEYLQQLCFNMHNYTKMRENEMFLTWESMA